MIFHFLLTFSHSAYVYKDPTKESYFVNQNQGFMSEIGKTFRRLPDRAKGVVPDIVYTRLQSSASIKVIFYTNSPSIDIKYDRANMWTFAMMASTGTSGLSLYARDQDGIDHFCAGEIVINTNNGIFSYHGLPSDHDYEYHLFLTNYDQVKSLSIGVEEGSTFEFVPTYNERPIICYGTSITHGASPSHPAMSWVNIVNRNLVYSWHNFGIMGYAMMEDSVIDFVTQEEAKVYVYDCLPNLVFQTVEHTYERLVNGVDMTRARYPNVPIVLVEFGMYTQEKFVQKYIDVQNNMKEASTRAWKYFNDNNYQNLYLVTHEELNYTSDDISDQVHPMDNGMMKHAKALLKPLRQILGLIENPSMTTLRAASQYRYRDFRKRQYNILQGVKDAATKPTKVLFGDSIIQEWEGKASFPAGYTNMGCNKDRIENILWRTIHDNLYNFTAEKIVVFAGAENLDVNTDEEITEGLKHLLKTIKVQQPSSNIVLCGIQPSKGKESRMSTLNTKISSMVSSSESGATYSDPASVLLNGQTINAAYFEADGIKLNDQGYTKLAERINAL